MFSLLLTWLCYVLQTSHIKTNLYVRMYYGWLWAGYVCSNCAFYFWSLSIQPVGCMLLVGGMGYQERDYIFFSIYFPPNSRSTASLRRQFIYTQALCMPAFKARWRPGAVRSYFKCSLSEALPSISQCCKKWHRHRLKAIGVRGGRTHTTPSL